MISTKGRYALKVMMDLAENGREGLVPLKDVAERQDISKKYLEVIVSSLVKGKMIKGFSGKGGGYTLSRAPEEYTVGEILELTEGSLAAVSCLDKESDSCPCSSDCKALAFWIEYNKIVNDFLFSKRLSDLI